MTFDSTTRVLQVLTVADTLVFFRGLTRYLASRNIEVAFACAPDPRVAAFAAQEGARTFPIAIPRSVDPLGDLRAVWELVEVLRAFEPDVVHAHTPKGGLVGMSAAALTRIKRRIYTLHGAPFETKRGMMRQALLAAERASIACATDVFAVSPSLAKLATEEHLSPLRPIFVHGNGTLTGIDLQRFSTTDKSAVRAEVREKYNAQRTFVFGFVGRLTEDKGIADLLEAWRIARFDSNAVQLWVIGDEDQREPLSDVLRAAMASNGIKRISHVEDIERLYAGLDVLVLPSYREGFPTVPLEAAALEVPTITTPATGCIDAVLDEKTGWIVPTHSPSRLAHCMQRAVDNPEQVHVFGKAAMARVETEFAQSQRFHALAKLYSRENYPRG